MYYLTEEETCVCCIQIYRNKTGNPFKYFVQGHDDHDLGMLCQTSHSLLWKTAKLLPSYKEVCLCNKVGAWLVISLSILLPVLVPVNLIHFQCPWALPSYCNPDWFSFLLCQNFEPVSWEFVFKQLWFSLGKHIWI